MVLGIRCKPWRVVSQLEGYVQNNMDCNDENADEFPEQEWYLDADGDGFGSAIDTLIQCAHPTAMFSIQMIAMI